VEVVGVGRGGGLKSVGIEPRVAASQLTEGLDEGLGPCQHVGVPHLNPNSWSTCALVAHSHVSNSIYVVIPHFWTPPPSHHRRHVTHRWQTSPSKTLPPETICFLDFTAAQGTRCCCIFTSACSGWLSESCCGNPNSYLCST
jgi:hypothetical protein